MSKGPSLDPIDTLCAVADFINRVYIDEAIRKLGPNIAEGLDRLQKRVAATIDKAMTKPPGCEACYFTGHAHASTDPCPVCCKPKGDDLKPESDDPANALEPHNVD
jgi:hypothetical protein